MAVIRSHSGRVLLDTAMALIIVPIESTQAHEFNFQPCQFSYRCPIREALVPCYTLRPTAARNDYHRSFYAYFCNYEADRVRTARIGQAMDYFFTASLSGCSVGFGPPDATGRRLVGHANAMTLTVQVDNMLGGAPVPTIRLVQQQFQKSMLNNVDRNLDVHHAPNYGIPLESTDPLRTTLIGFRDRASGRWSFIRQTYDQNFFE